MAAGIVWNKRTGHVVGGHQRLAVLRELGVADDQALDVVVVHLDDAHERGCNLALNNIAGEWEPGKLVEAMLSIQFDLLDDTLTGFERDEIEAMIASELADLGPAESSPGTSEGGGGVSGRVGEAKQDTTELGGVTDVLIGCSAESEAAVIVAKAAALGYSSRRVYHLPRRRSRRRRRNGNAVRVGCRSGRRLSV